MITPLQIVNHLAEYMPRVSDYFSDSIAVDSATIERGRTITVNTTSAHGLSAGDPVMIIGGQTQNEIDAVSEGTEDDTAVIVFKSVHDFTGPSGDISSESLPCTGFNESVWNTSLTITEVPTTSSVIVNYPTGATAAPTLTTAYGYEERPLSIFGTQSVASVASTTRFIVELSSDVPELPDGTILNLSITTGVRIASADNIQRANEIYSKVAQNDALWAFVIMGDADISKDRNTLNDGVGSFTEQNIQRLRTLVNFSIVVFFGSSNSISGATAQTIAYGQLYEDFLKVLYGFGFFDSDSLSQFVTVSAGHGVAQLDGGTAYYMHAYDWQTPFDINFESGFDMYEDVAFREIAGSLAMFTPDGNEKLEYGIKLLPEYVAPEQTMYQNDYTSDPIGAFDIANSDYISTSLTYSTGGDPNNVGTITADGFVESSSSIPVIFQLSGFESDNTMSISFDFELTATGVDFTIAPAATTGLSARLRTLAFGDFTIAHSGVDDTSTDTIVLGVPQWQGLPINLTMALNGTSLTTTISIDGTQEYQKSFVADVTPQQLFSLVFGNYVQVKALEIGL